MSDIYKTLRDIEDDKYEGWASAEQCGLAADEIERLRARNKRLEEALEQVMAMMIERGSNNLPLGQVVRAALED